jgi:hypothetical protein
MKAVNILNGKVYEVLTYKNLIYRKNDSESLPYYIFEISNLTEEEIPIGYEYTYYRIEGNLYSGFLTNVLESHASEQIDIWEMIK